LWLDGNDPAATGVQPANSSTVSTWVDKSGNANNGISGSATFIKDSLGGYINFTGSQYYDITNPNIVVNQYFTVFIVEQIGDVPLSTNYALMGGTSQSDNANLHIVYLNSNTIRFARWNNDLDASMSAYGYGTGTTQPTRLWSFSFTASSRIIFLNGTSIGSDANNTFLSSATGTAIGRVLTQNYYTGKMREVMIYSGTIDTTQRKQIEGYLARKWNLTLENLFIPTSVSNCVLWLDADDSTKFTGGANWLDKSGTNNHGINGTANVSAMPTVTTWSNGRRAARFVSASKNSMKSTNAISNFTSYFMVARIQAAVGYGFFMINNYDGQRQMPMNTTSFPATVYFYTGGNIMTIGSFAQSEGFIFCGTVTNGSSFTYGNGVQTGTNASVSYSASSDHYFGSANGDAGYLSIDIAEIIVYTGVVSSTDRQSIENYLSVKWNIPLSRSGVTINPFNYIRPFSRRFNPIDISGCQLWLDAADYSTITGTTSVTAWADKSGNGRNATGGVSPTLSTNGITFNGTSQYLATTYSAVPSSESVFVVFTWTGTVDRNYCIIGTSATNGRNYNVLKTTDSNVVKWDRWGVAGYAPTSGVVSNVQYMSSGIYNGTTGTTGLNGGSQSTAASFTFSGSGITHIGTGVLGDWFSGTINEIIVYNSALTTYQRQQVEGYLAHKWGLTSNFFTPLTIPGCQLWLDAADSSTITFGTGLSVASWRDKANNYAVANSSAAHRPVYAQGTIRFDGLTSISYLDIPTLTIGSSTFSIFFVARNTSTTTDPGNASSPQIFWPLSGNGSGALSINGWISTNIQGVNNNINSVLLKNQYYLFSYTFGVTANSEQLYVNGISVGTYSKGSAYASSLYRIGAINTTSQQFSFDGNIAEILVYNTAVTTTQRQQIEGYLSQKWGLGVSSTTTSTHPFYRIPPSSILPFLPRGISGCQLWLDGADPAGTGIQPANGSSVLTWVDKSGNGRNATVVTTPLVKSAATYSTEFSALNFSDSNRAYVTTYPANPVNETVFVVFNNPSPDSRNYSLINGQAGARALGTAWANATNAGTRVAYLNNDVAWSTAVTPELSYTAGTTRILTGQVSNSTNHSIALNGSNFSTGSTASGFSANTFTYLGWNANSGSFAGAGNPTMYYYIGYAMEIIFYDSVLTTAQRQQVEGYLSEKWGLRSFLPSTHLYKSFAPSFLPYAITSSGSGGAYSNFLWTRFYNITSSGPSTNGPGSSGWGSLIGTAGAYNPINYQDGDSRIGQSDQVGVISKGFMYSASATVVTFRTVSDDGILVIFNGTNVINNWTLHGDTTDTSASVTLPAGYTPIELRFFEWGGGFTCELYWSVGSTGTYVSDGTSRMFHNDTSKS
jgi:hypothetical protein